MDNRLLEINNLKISFYHQHRSIQVVRGFDLSLNNREIVGIIGESGSGKTVSATSILKLEDETQSIDSGTIIFNGINLLELSEKEYQKIRGNQISYIFQNASSALNPYKKIGLQLTEVLRNHKLPFSKNIVLDVLKEVGIEEADTSYDMYPFQLSGGQNQRIMIAQGIISKPDLLIADEPTSSIDASLKRTVLDLLKKINQKSHMAIIFITHDFEAAKYLCEKLIIMYGGLVMEEGEVNEIFAKPLHPYTEELIKCANSLTQGDLNVYTLEGTAPTPLQFKEECPFISRCKMKLPECSFGIPKMTTLGTRKVRCIKYETR
ncbi:MAG: ABC transporter ATP-binding protein [Tissierellales bacterium]|nr:ABC transporter ATP-binding protein [Tissierellales bacterium]MBN2826638.1 ABC transporter ATP-binding protein [Tissierellales bacterium]